MSALSNIMDESYKGRDPAYERMVMEIAGKIAPERAMGFCAGYPHRGSFWSINNALKKERRKGVNEYR